MSRITTVADKAGDVWTGREVSSDITANDVGAAILSCGLTAVAQAMAHDDGSRTVVVNGERHSGTKVSSR